MKDDPNPQRISKPRMGVDTVFSYIAEEDGNFLDACYCVSRISMELDRPPIDMRDVRFANMKPWRDVSRKAVAFSDLRNEKDLKELEDSDE